MEEHNNVILFDGACNFCNQSVNLFFSKRRRRSNNIKFASLQSPFAKSILPERLTNVSEFDTIHFVSDGKLYDRSSAILKICKFLKVPFRWATIFLIVPKVIRDFVYKIISKNRHRIIKKKVSCRMTDKFEKSFFIDNETGKKLNL